MGSKMHLAILALIRLAPDLQRANPLEEKNASKLGLELGSERGGEKDLATLWAAL